MVRLINFPAYGGMREMDPMANTRHTKPLRFAYISRQFGTGKR